HRQASNADCLVDLRQRLIIGNAQREFGNRVGRGGGDEIAIRLRMWATFGRRARIHTHRKARHLFDLREHPGLPQPPASGRGERDRDRPAHLLSWPDQTRNQLTQSTAASTNQTQDPRTHAATPRPGNARPAPAAVTIFYPRSPEPGGTSTAPPPGPPHCAARSPATS